MTIDTVKFDRTYADFGPKVRDFERSAEVIQVVEGFMKQWNYSLLDLMGSEFTAQWLREGEMPENDPDTLDLIFEIATQGFYEIVLRDGDGNAVYGGYLFGVQPVKITDEIVNGYRVLLATQADGGEARYGFSPGAGYTLMPGATGAFPLPVARRMAS